MTLTVHSQCSQYIKLMYWMQPMESDILVKPIKDDPGVQYHIKSENEISSDEEDLELSGDEAIYTHT